MPIPICCPACGKTYQVREELVGRRAKCGCGQVMTVPEQPALTDLPDDELLAGTARPLGSGSAAPLPTPPKRRLRNRRPNPLLVGGLIGGGLLSVALIGLLVYGLTDRDDASSSGVRPSDASLRRPADGAGNAPVAPPLPPTSLPQKPGGTESPRGSGYPTPEEAFQAYKQAMIADDGTVWEILTPESVDQWVVAQAWLLRREHRQSPQAVGLLQRHGLVEQVWTIDRSEAPDESEVRKRPFETLSEAAQTAGRVNDRILAAVRDKFRFLTEVSSFLNEKTTPRFRQVDRKLRENKFGPAKLVDLRFEGDRAAGDWSYIWRGGSGEETRTETTYFQQINGRWYVRDLDSEKKIKKP